MEPARWRVAARLLALASGQDLQQLGEVFGETAHGAAVVEALTVGGHDDPAQLRGRERGSGLGGVDGDTVDGFATARPGVGIDRQPKQVDRIGFRGRGGRTDPRSRLLTRPGSPTAAAQTRRGVSRPASPGSPTHQHAAATASDRRQFRCRGRGATVAVLPDASASRNPEPATASSSNEPVTDPSPRRRAVQNRRRAWSSGSSPSGSTANKKYATICLNCTNPTSAAAATNTPCAATNS